MSEEKKRCGARKKSGGTCKHRPLKGRTKCRLHGGATPVGIESPHFKHGGRSRYPAAAMGALGERYTTHLQDMDYVALRDEIALVTAQIEEEVLRIAQLRETPAEGLDRSDIRRRVREAKQAEARMFELMDLKRVLTQAEVRRVKIARDTLTGEQIKLFAASMLQANRRAAAEFIPDPARRADFLGRVQHDVVHILRSIGAIPALNAG